MRGRKPKPLGQRRLEGNPGKRRMPQERSLPPAVPGAPPAWWPADAREFDRLYGTQIRSAAEARNIDEPAYQLMALAWGRAIQSARLLRREGLKPKHRKGRHPVESTWRESVQLFTGIASRFGLTPSDRARLLTIEQAQPRETGILDGDWQPEAARVQ